MPRANKGYLFIYLFYLPATRHFNQQDHDFNKDASFTVIEQLKNV